MIEPTSLRLGNLAMYGVHIVPIRSIHVTDEDAWVYIELNGKLKNYCVDISEIEPIPLTEELLLRFGAAKRTADYPSYVLHGVHIDFIRNKWIEYITQIPIETAHHLQNFIYYRTNQELKLEG
jgi:hypothetical protein